MAVPLTPIPRNAFMMPHTVPNRPMNGVALAVVARNPRLRSRSPSWTEALLRSTRSTASRPSRVDQLPRAAG